MLLGMLIVYPNYGYAEKRPSELDYKTLHEKALKGDAEAQYWMGKTYLEGRLDCDKDTLLAVKWLELSAKSNDCYAQYKLAYMYYNGLGVEMNRVEAIKLYKLCADSLFKDTDIKFKYESRLKYAEALGKGIYGERQNVKEAIKIVSELLDDDESLEILDLFYHHIRPMLNQLLGLFYYNLGLSSKDMEEKLNSFSNSSFYYSEATYYWEQWGADYSYSEQAQHNLAESYNGLGDALLLNNTYTKMTDYNNVIHAYQKAIEYGSEAAMYIVGDMLFSGIENIPADKAKAISLFTRLVGKDIRATYRLATYYYTDKIDYPIAFKYYKAIAEDSSEIDNSVRADALQHLSRMYLFGRGVEVDNDLADKYAQQAVKYGDISSSAISNFLKQTSLSSNSINMAQ
jgi:hypothetical protein